VDASRVRSDGTVEHRRRRFGGMILARAPILSCRVFPLRKLDPPGLGGMQTAVVEAVVRFGESAVRFYGVHLDDALTRVRLMQIEDLMALVRDAPAQGGAMTGTMDPRDSYADENWTNGETNPPMPGPAIVMGDFNAAPDGPEYDALVGASDARQGRVVTRDHLVDAMTGSEPTWYGDPARTDERPARLDYVFFTADLAPGLRRAWIDQDADGSDHQPVWAELEL
jgi:endonuclease/exonuclease/phosphatase family metal-dependent hydrolase